MRGVDDREVNPNRIRKSISAETTFSENKQSTAELHGAISDVAERLIGRIKKADAAGYTVTLKVKYADFEIISRRITVSQPVVTKEAVVDLAKKLLEQVNLDRPVRLIGIGVSNLKSQYPSTEPQQPQFEF